MWASESWRHVLDHIVTGTNGKSVKGVMIQERIVCRGRNSNDAKGPTWIWRIGMADEFEKGKLERGSEEWEVWMGMGRGGILRFRENKTGIMF